MNRTETTGSHDSRLPGLCNWIAIAFAVFFCAAHAAWSAPVSADAATGAAQGWLRQDRHPLGGAMSAKIKRTEAVKNSSGAVVYYVAHLDPAGFVILPADDLADPIAAFSATGSFDGTSAGPLADLVNRDLPRRVARARAGGATAAGLKARRKWNAFRAGSANPPPDVEENGNIVIASQIWVAPFVQTLWSQQTDVSENYAVYNYYTPPFGAGNTNNDPCGCVATALAQEMFYFQYPTVSVGTASFTITNNGVSSNVSLFGGPYQWTNMPLAPNNPTTNQAMAIGALTHDAATAVNMYYTPTGSSAYTYIAQQALTNTFKFANAAYYEQDTVGLSGSSLADMINPNLDARLPVILGIQPDGGHCVVCDGYGYSASTLFHHLNMGYAGDDDVWYALPTIDTVDGNGDFTLVVACIYNIYTNSTGQILSGRVTDATGAPVAGAGVTAARNGGGTWQTMTDSNGVYALASIPANSTYTVTVTNTGGASAMGTFSTGTSVYNALPSGNVWGANFVLSPPLLAIPETGFSSIGPVQGPFSVTAQFYTLTNTTGSSINWQLANTNTWLSASSSNGVLAAGAATNLMISLNSATNTLTAGTYSGSIWITNLNNGLTQQLNFSLALKTADYPLAVTGYNLDVVVENAAVGGVTLDYADAFDSLDNDFDPPDPACFYESGLVVFNLANNEPATSGLPTNGLFTSLADGATTFQLGPYESGNVLYLTESAPSGSLTLDAQVPCRSLSILAASAQGGGGGTMAIHFADGSVSSNFTYNASNYLASNNPAAGAAITNFGLLAVGELNEYYSLDPVDNTLPFPALYQTTINLESAGYSTNPIASLTFTKAGGAGTATGIFAVSGTQAPYSGDYSLIVTASPSVGGAVSGGGIFAAGTTNTVTATPNSAYTFSGWTLDGIIVSTSPTYTFILNGSETLVANFLAKSASLSVTVTTNGEGAVLPNLNGKTLLKGHSYTLTAIPASGNLFSNWSGSFNTNRNPLSFVAEFSMVLQANFVTNPFLPLKGAYNGLFTPSNGVTEETAGMLKGLTVGAKGAYSGALLLNGASHALSGTFSLGGLASNKISRPASQGGPLGVEMKLVTNGPAPQITGTVSATNWSASLTADLATNTIPSAQYTLLLPPDTNNAPPASSPGGDGYALITNYAGTAKNPASANARITGALADGTAFNQTVPVSADGYVPIYANLYASKGLLLGWINLNLTNTAGSSLTWIHPATRAGLYSNGFTNILLTNQIQLSLWTNDSANIALLTNLSLLETSGDTNTLTNATVSIASTGKITGSSVSGTLNPKTGFLTVTIGTGASRVTGYGAVLLDATNGGGYFVTKTNAQAIGLGP